MMLQAFSVFDKAVNAFMPPFFARSTGEAMRSFEELANDATTNVSKHPSDFVLFRIGEFNDSSGIFDVAEPTRLVGAYEVVREVAPYGMAPRGVNGGEVSPAR